MKNLRAARLWAVLACAIIGLGVAPAAGQTRGYETPPNFSSNQVLPPALRQSPYHSILDPVQKEIHAGDSRGHQVALLAVKLEIAVFLPLTFELGHGRK